IVPSLVKSRFSPKEAWRDRPFSDKDGQFFFRGIEELSDQFTVDRPSRARTGKPTRIPAYFRHPRFRSAYLLYFLPLQAAKFNAVFQFHPAAIDALIKDSGTPAKGPVSDDGSREPTD